MKENMNYSNRTFISFYGFKNGKIKEIFIRPAITAIKTPVFKGTFAATSDNTVIGNLITDIIAVGENNEISPITTLNETALTDALTDIVTAGLSVTENNSNTASLKIGFAISLTGPNAGKPVFILTYKHLKEVVVSEVSLETIA